VRHPHLHPESAPRRPRLAGRAALMTLLVLALAACGDAPQNVLDPQGPASQKPDDLFKIVLIIALVVFLIVQGLIVYAVVKYRDNGDDELPKQVHGNTKLELVWTIVPALILAVIAVPTVKTVFDLAETPDDAMVVEVIGHRWWWEYQYPGVGPDGTDVVITANEMVLPTDTDIVLKMTSQESGGPANAVIHSYWIPALAGKQDVVPGRITTINLTTSGEGVYMGQCTEFCGLSHANMRNYATVIPQAEFDAWIAAQLAPAEMPAEGTDAAEGARLFSEMRDVEGLGQRACVSCHAIAGYVGPDGGTAAAGVGPNLTHLMDREMFAGSIFDLYQRGEGSWGNWTDVPNEEDLVAWVMDAPSMKAMRATGQNAVGMPNLGLTEQESSQIVAYLLTLR
jgi:cytochrome c oxidase subunit 2